VVYLDFLKAFDMVPHRRLVHKLKGFGMRMDLLSWFESFLSNRRQRVVLGDVISSWRVVRSGVPQGSVLGPLLFVLYINDLPEYVEDTCKLYADGSKLISIVETMESVARTQRSVDGITEWTKRWLVRLNAKKCVVMHFGRANLRANYTIEEYGTGERVVMNESRCERDLGV
jgi:ribonuclease P/MRP protein subunit RPP40